MLIPLSYQRGAQQFVIPKAVTINLLPGSKHQVHPICHRSHFIFIALWCPQGMAIYLENNPMQRRGRPSIPGALWL